MSNLQTIFLHNEHRFLKNPDLLNNITKTSNEIKKMSDLLLTADMMNLLMTYEKLGTYRRMLRKYIDEAIHRGLGEQPTAGYAAVISVPTMEQACNITGLSIGSIEGLARFISERDIQKFLSFIIPFENTTPGGSKILVAKFIPAVISNVVNNQVYSFEQLKDLWIQNGGNHEDAGIMAAIALAESSGRVSVINKSNSNGTWDIGLWQINTIHQGAFGLPTINDYKNPIFGSESYVSHLSDANNNAKAAVQIKKVQGFKAWVTFNAGTYAKFLN